MWTFKVIISLSTLCYIKINIKIRRIEQTPDGYLGIHHPALVVAMHE